MLEGFLDGGLGLAGVRADELGKAVDNHLGSVRRFGFEWAAYSCWRRVQSGEE